MPPKYSNAPQNLSLELAGLNDQLLADSPQPASWPPLAAVALAAPQTINSMQQLAALGSAGCEEPQRAPAPLLPPPDALSERRKSLPVRLSPLSRGPLSFDGAAAGGQAADMSTDGTGSGSGVPSTSGEGCRPDGGGGAAEDTQFTEWIWRRSGDGKPGGGRGSRSMEVRRPRLQWAYEVERRTSSDDSGRPLPQRLQEFALHSPPPPPPPPRLLSGCSFRGSSDELQRGRGGGGGGGAGDISMRFVNSDARLDYGSADVEWRRRSLAADTSLPRQ